MKIMFYAISLGKGGAERVISVLANNLSQNYDVSIVVNTLKNKAYKIDDKVKLYELDNKKRKFSIIRNIYRMFNTNKIIKEEKPTIIISFLPIPSFRILFLKYFHKIPVIVSDRNDPSIEYKKLISKILMKTLYPKADGFVFQTNDQKLYFNKKIQDKSTIIQNPLKDEFLDNNNNTKKENIIISVGRLIEQKNHKMLIDSFSELSATTKNYKLKIFGDGPLKSELTDYIKSKHLQDKILLCGISDNIKKELLNSKIFVLSSNYEGMPNVLIEAMATGLPCISTNCPCGGPKELINNNKNGFLIEVNNKNELTEILNKLINDEKLQNTIGNNAKKIREKLNSKIIVKKWIEYIKKIEK